MLIFTVLQEPSDNGPLFSELKFYMRAAKPDLSMPLWLQTHSHMHDEPGWKKVGRATLLIKESSELTIEGLMKTDEPQLSALGGSYGCPKATVLRFI